MTSSGTEILYQDLKHLINLEWVSLGLLIGIGLLIVMLGGILFFEIRRFSGQTAIDRTKQEANNGTLLTIVRELKETNIAIKECITRLTGVFEKMQGDLQNHERQDNRSLDSIKQSLINLDNKIKQ